MPNPLYDDGVLSVGEETVSTELTVTMTSAAIFGLPEFDQWAVRHIDAREVERLHEALGEWLQERGRA